MSLIDEVTRIRNDSLSSLDASHDYYAHTKIAWRLIQRLVQKGHKFTSRNSVTGTKVDEAEFLGLAQGYVTGYLASSSFQHFVSLFERFVFDFLRTWLAAYPASLAGKQVEFRTVLDAAGIDEIVDSVVEREVRELAYQPLPDWFAYLKRRVKLGCPDQDQIARLSEVKASRDVLVHSDGIASAIYVDKAMGRARFAPGERLELPEHYHRDSWKLIKDIVSSVSDAAIEKLDS